MRTVRVGVASFVLLVAVSLLIVPAGRAEAAALQGQGITSFAGTIPDTLRRDPNILYDLNLAQERYFYFVPASYTGKEPYGLIVFTTPGEVMAELPPGWKAVLERRKLILVAAQAAGNSQNDNRRCGLAVLGALMAQQNFKIDPNRVYAAGFSGGARMSCRLGLYQPEIFRGTIQSCGGDFYEPVAQVHPVPAQVAAMGPYGPIRAPADVDQAKQNVRFVIITGSKDFRYANLQNIYEGGFAKAGFKAKLIDVPGSGHDNCGPGTLTQALDFIEGVPSESSPPASSAAAAPAWMAQPANRWPQMLLELDIVFKDRTHVTGASCFLVRLPNGSIVAATARHAACPTMTVEAFEASFTSFMMHPRTGTERKVTLRKAAIKSADAEKLDCLLMAVPPQGLPVEVRPARTTPAEEGETVYLLAVPYSEHTAQNVYKGTVRRCLNDNEFAYDFEDNAESSGFSGAPVLDASGNIVGIHLGKIDFHEGKPLRRALNMSVAVAACTAPATSRPAAKIASSQPAKPPTPAPAAAATRPRMIAIPAPVR